MCEGMNRYEKDVEQGLIERLQQFMMELGKGFAFVARQKRLHAEGDDFFVDLVFYNYLLKCFVLIDLKTGKLTIISKCAISYSATKSDIRNIFYLNRNAIWIIFYCNIFYVFK